MTQSGSEQGRDYKPPIPRVLESLVARLTYKQGWRFEFISMETLHHWGSRAFLEVRIKTMNSLESHQEVDIAHRITIPDVPEHMLDDAEFWRRWLLDQVFNIERHEAMKFFRIDGDAPFFPDHMGNPYRVMLRPDYKELTEHERYARIQEQAKQIGNAFAFCE